jgi:hypothetical protein
MNKLKELITLCKYSICIDINTHKDDYKTVEDYFRVVFLLDEDMKSEIEKDVYNEMIKRDFIVKIQCYPNTPVGFFVVYHYDIEKAINEMIDLLKMDGDLYDL